MAVEFDPSDDAKLRSAVESNRESIRRLQTDVERLTNLLEFCSLKSRPQPLPHDPLPGLPLDPPPSPVT